jgi:hypothetical protein
MRAVIDKIDASWTRSDFDMMESQMSAAALRPLA